MNLGLKYVPVKKKEADFDVGLKFYMCWLAIWQVTLHTFAYV